MDVKNAIHFWGERPSESGTIPMNETGRANAIDTFIREHNTCAFATCDLDGNVRNTPVEYLYYEGCFWIMSEGGHKFQGLAVNAKVSLAIYEKYEGFGRLSGLQVQGRAAMVEFWSEEYLAYLARRGLPEARLRSMAHPMYLIRIEPVCYDLLCSELKTRGYSVRQHLEVAGNQK